MGISSKKLEKIGELSFHNAVRLHKDSIHLHKKKSFASAYFLSILALEEIGKVHMVEKGLHWDDGLGELEQDFLNMFYSHLGKQSYFFHNSYFNNWSEHGDTHKRFLEGVSKGKLESVKQNSVYVGLPKKGKKVNIKGRLSNPLKISEAKAFKQITLMSDEILSLSFGYIYEIYGIDNELIIRHFTRAFFNRVQKIWPFKSLKAKRYFEKTVKKLKKTYKPLNIL